jgi:hypothetical protein
MKTSQPPDMEAAADHESQVPKGGDSVDCLVGRFWRVEQLCPNRHGGGVGYLGLTDDRSRVHPQAEVKFECTKSEYEEAAKCFVEGWLEKEKPAWAKNAIAWEASNSSNASSDRIPGSRPGIRSTAGFADFMKLFKVQLYYETVIRAASSEAAEKEAKYAIRHEIDDEPLSVDAFELADVNDLPQGWNPQCRPWGERDPYDRTIGQILSANGALSSGEGAE